MRSLHDLYLILNILMDILTGNNISFVLSQSKYDLLCVLSKRVFMLPELIVLQNLVTKTFC